eukprot:Phypoly_transcript_12321.p1 GENE.Phypoly_transcript_12321~~Phypoly_transcript_12321.p1  ORF type:complete len:316 (+),score=55.11 Phypoly_transcript_12321:150-1097(+)
MKKCSRCGAYFHNDEPNCVYHSAPWVDLHVPGKGGLGVWTCCKEAHYTATGCVSSPHLEDKTTTEMLRKFEIFAVKGTRAQALELLDAEFIRKNIGTPQIHAVSPVGHDHVRVDPSVFAKTYWNTYVSEHEDTHIVGYAKKPLPNYVPMRVFKRNKEEEPTPEGFEKYTIKTTDTIQGISLRFNTTVAAIKQLNKLYSDVDLHKLKTLLIPTTPDPNSARPFASASSLDSFTRAWHITKLAIGKGVCPEEALFYLSDNGWDLASASASLESDIAWAEAELAKQKGKLMEFLGDTDVQTVAVVAAGCIIVLLCIVL